jgi:hypothetical protein
MAVTSKFVNKKKGQEMNEHIHQVASVYPNEFSKADMELPFATYNAELLAVIAPQLEAELTEQLAQKTFSEEAKGALKRLLAGQRPGIQGLASELHLSTRTLQRRLTGEVSRFSVCSKKRVGSWPAITCSIHLWS